MSKDSEWRAKIEEYKGKTVGDCAAGLGVNRSTIAYWINKLDMQGFFPRTPLKPIATKQWYLDHKHLTLPEISKKLSLSISRVRKHIEKHGLGKPWKIEPRECDELDCDVVYFETLDFTCMSPRCSQEFKKDISLDVPEHKRSKMPFMCPNCKDGKRPEMVYEYPV